ncbi:hypothetical protein RFI_17013, partial [Reticulomyxa filosa]
QQQQQQSNQTATTTQGSTDHWDLEAYIWKELHNRDRECSDIFVQLTHGNECVYWCKMIGDLYQIECELMGDDSIDSDTKLISQWKTLGFYSIAQCIACRHLQPFAPVVLALAFNSARVYFRLLARPQTAFLSLLRAYMRAVTFLQSQMPGFDVFLRKYKLLPVVPAFADTNASKFILFEQPEEEGEEEEVTVRLRVEAEPEEDEEKRENNDDNDEEKEVKRNLCSDKEKKIDQTVHEFQLKHNDTLLLLQQLHHQLTNWFPFQ